MLIDTAFVWVGFCLFFGKGHYGRTNPAPRPSFREALRFYPDECDREAVLPQPPWADKPFLCEEHYREAVARMTGEAKEEAEPAAEGANEGSKR